MWIQADYEQIKSEVKERNRYFMALNEIRKTAATNYDKNISLEVKEQFRLIVEQCEAALGPTSSVSN